MIREEKRNAMFLVGVADLREEKMVRKLLGRGARKELGSLDRCGWKYVKVRGTGEAKAPQQIM